MANQRGIITFQTPKKCMKVRRLVPTDSNDEESGEGSGVARGPQVPHKQQIPDPPNLRTGENTSMKNLLGVLVSTLT